jgi:hypothetical protein
MGRNIWITLFKNSLWIYILKQLKDLNKSYLDKKIHVPFVSSHALRDAFFSFLFFCFNPLIKGNKNFKSYGMNCESEIDYSASDVSGYLARAWFSFSEALIGQKNATINASSS